MRKIYFLFLIVLLICSASAQKPTQQWGNTFGSSILWMQIAPTGELLLATSAGLKGVDAQTGNELWNIASLTNLVESEFSFVPNTPFGAVIRQEGMLQSHLLFNLSDGKVLCDTKGDKIAVARRHILTSTGDILIQGLQDKSAILALYDIKTGKPRWIQKDLFGKSIFSEQIDGKPLEVTNGNFIMATYGGTKGGGIYCLSIKDGSKVWEAALPKVSGAQTSTPNEAKLLSANPDSDAFYFMKGTNIMAYSKTDGKQLWSQPAKQRGLPDAIVYDPEGLIVGSIIDPGNNIVKPVINMYDYATGTEKWPKPAKLAGSIRQYKYVDQGLAIAMETGQGNYLINIVDLNSGDFLYEKGAKLKGELKELRAASNGLFFRASSEINILDLQSGANVHAKSIKCKEEQQLLYAWKDSHCYVFNPADALLYDINLSDGSLQSIGTQVSFEQKESPTAIEVRTNGILLTSSQNLLLLDFNGKEIYRKHIPAPGESGWRKALYATSAVLNAMDGMKYYELAASAEAAKKDVSTPQGREFCDKVGQFGNTVGNMRMESAAKDMERMKARFKASAGGDNTYFMMSKLSDGTLGLTAINKVDGSSSGEISFAKDKQPKYE
ncbi:MAG: PQQ-binding-like beta-propeller repeat protein, partial [Flavobacteriales bacterium]